MKLYQQFKITDHFDVSIFNDLLAMQKTVCLLNSNNYSPDAYSRFKLVLGIGAHNFIQSTHSNPKSLDDLFRFQKENADWLLGFFTYDLKNQLENLKSKNADNLGFPDYFFFQPQVLMLLDYSDNCFLFCANEAYNSVALSLFQRIQSSENSTLKPLNSSTISIQTRFSKEKYIAAVNVVKNHIQQGDVYELNLCQEFFAENVEIEAYQTYLHLNEKSKMPFSCYFQTNENYLLCASPERFLYKKDRKIISQPIKGTSKRNTEIMSDSEAIKLLQNNEKERAENIMIVDLVRNDLSRIASQKSVKVESLCKVVAFPKLYQMISTVSAELNENCNWMDAVKASFPMGSMTGAPKIRAMELIDDYELNKRALYSGSVGYISPEADFDFNVVIRSVQYNAQSKYLSFTTGSAITIQSNAENEYQECMLKAQAIFEVLQK